MAARCYCGCERRVKPGDFFATNKCAREWAEELVEGNQQRWCEDCQQWTGQDPYGQNPDECCFCGATYTERT